VPAHLAVLHPFMPPAEVTLEVLERADTALRGMRAFDFVLGRVARFPGVRNWPRSRLCPSVH